MSNAMSSSGFLNGQPQPNGEATHAHSHVRATSMSGGLNSGFQMPLNSNPVKTHRASTSSTSTISGLPAGGRGHQRTGSASSTWARQGLGGGGVLNFALPTSSAAPRLATHSESSDPSRSSSASESEPILILDSAFPRTGTKIPAATTGGRRESVSADKALREVQRALAASVEAQG
jgi:hypothetical protein